MLLQNAIEQLQAYGDPDFTLKTIFPTGQRYTK